MKYLIFVACLLGLLTTKAQDISCQELFEIVTTDYDSKSTTMAYGSSMLAKVEYYKLEGTGFVVAYIKDNSYDYSGTPYIFCGISSQRWNNFTTEGIYSSYGKAFHKYIMDYTCNCY